MFAPFYFLFIPLAVILAIVVWVLFFRVSHDRKSTLGKGNRGPIKSDLEKAQELDRRSSSGG